MTANKETLRQTYSRTEHSLPTVIIDTAIIIIIIIIITPWLKEPRGSTPHSQELSNNPYPEPNQPNYSY